MLEIISKHIPLGLLTLLGCKAVFIGLHWEDSVIGLGLLGVLAVERYLERRKRLEEIESVIKEQNRVIEALAKELDNVRTSVSGIKLKSGMSR